MWCGGWYRVVASAAGSARPARGSKLPCRTLVWPLAPGASEWETTQVQADGAANKNMKVVCSACSHEHDVSPAELSLGSSCVRCGQTLGNGKLDLGSNGKLEFGDQLELGVQPDLGRKAGAAHSYSMPSRARDDMRAATKDLFGSIEPPKPSSPALARPHEPEPTAPPAMTSNENSIMFSLESLMKARGAGTPAAPQVETVSEQQLWDMSGAAPLFGTAQDQALLTTPLQQPAPPVHVMTLPSRPPRRRGRWKWIASGVGVCGMAVAGWWLLNARSTVQATVPSNEPALAQAPTAAAPEVKPEPPAAQANLAAAVAQSAITQGAVAQGEGQAIDPSAAEPAAGSVDPAAPAATAEAAPVASDAPAPSTEASAAPNAPPVEPNNAPDSKKRATRNTKKVASTEPAPKAKGPGLPFNVGAAKDALGTASTKAAACGKSGPGGAGKVQVTFGPNGKVSSASLTSGSFAGSTQSCILRAFRAARVPAFAGNPITVAKSFKL
jgi:hypothetical protein